MVKGVVYIKFKMTVPRVMFIMKTPDIKFKIEKKETEKTDE